MEEPTDHQLLQGWRGGDADAGSALVRRHNRALCLFLLNKVGRDGVDDIAQDVYETLIKKADTVKPELSVRGFLFGIARMKVLEHYRKRSKREHRYQPLEQSAADVFGPTATQRLQAKQDGSLVVQALRRLEMDDQILLEMSVDMGMTRDELAQVYEATPGQIGGRVHRARAKLAKCLGELQANPELVASTETSLASYWRGVRELREEKQAEQKK